MASTSGDNYALLGRAIFDGVENLLGIQVVVSQHVGELIQHHQIVMRISQHALTFLPDCRCCLDICLSILRFPGKSSPHNMEFDAERLQSVVLTIIPLALNELRDANGFSVTNRARCRTKGCGGFSFTVTGEDYQDPFLLRCRRHAGINLLFQFLLTLAVPVIIGSRFHGDSLVSCRTSCAAMLLLKLAKEVIAFVVY